MFDFEDEEVVRIVKKRKAKRILLQFPEGLKRYAMATALGIGRETGASVFVSADPCYGACDVDVDAARSVQADLVIHYGHSQYCEDADIPTMYVETKWLGSISDALNKALPLLEPYRKIGLVTTIQHTHELESAREFLEKHGKTVRIGDSSTRFGRRGQILGCDFSSALSIQLEVDAFLFIGGGVFHPLGLALATDRVVIAADPFTLRVENLSDRKKRTLRMRWQALEAARKADRIGIVVGLKSGQKRLDEACRIKKMLENLGKEAVLICSREISPEIISNFTDLEAIVETGCPRIAVDDSSRFPIPVLNQREAMILVGEDSWEAYAGET